MTDRDNPGGGGMTGATGDLTPDVPDSAFEPNDPDDRMDETHPPAAGETAPTGETRIGGDDLAESEERF